MNRETKSEYKEYMKGAAVAMFLIFLIVLYVLEFDHFENTLQVQSLVVTAFIIGFVLGSLVAYWLTKNYENIVDRIQVIIPIILFSTILMPLFASLTNRLLVFESAKIEQLEYLQTNRFVKSRFGKLENLEKQNDGFFLFFIKNGEVERVKTEQHLYPSAERGDQIDIPITKGLWGYEFVQFEY